MNLIVILLLFCSLTLSSCLGTTPQPGQEELSTPPGVPGVTPLQSGGQEEEEEEAMPSLDAFSE